MNIKNSAKFLVLIWCLFSVCVLWASEPVDVNTADAAQLAQLKNVGEKKAQAIIEYRESHGKFATIEDLTKVKGIGPDTLEENRAILIASE